MSIEFCHDGVCYRLNTKDGEVHCEPISPEPQPVAMEAQGDDE